jgi:hypothetical protein
LEEEERGREALCVESGKLEKESRVELLRKHPHPPSLLHLQAKGHQLQWKRQFLFGLGRD